MPMPALEVGRKQSLWECVRSFFSHTHADRHTNLRSENYSHTTSLFALLHLSYSNLKLIFSHSYLPKPAHISPAVSLHFLLSATEKCDQCEHCFEIKYESSQIKIRCGYYLFIYYICCLFCFFNSQLAICGLCSLCFPSLFLLCVK